MNAVGEDASLLHTDAQKEPLLFERGLKRRRHFTRYEPPNYSRSITRLSHRNKNNSFCSAQSGVSQIEGKSGYKNVPV